MIASPLARGLDLNSGTIDGGVLVQRRLHDLSRCFADHAAFVNATLAGNPLVYTVSSIETAQGDGQLHYGLGRVLPGQIGDEYYLTKGHLHAWREAAEVYVGLRGHGYLLLEDENGGDPRLLPLGADRVVYVPGRTAHRSINTGTTALVYLGVYPAAAGHDYEPIEHRNFRHVVVRRDSGPTLLARSELTL